MILYASVISCAVLLVAIGGAIACNVGYFTALWYTALATAGVIAVDGVTAALCRCLPKKCADRRKRIFQVSRKEKSFYEKLKIRAWKDRLPEIGHLTGFRKNKLDLGGGAEYIEHFLLEICYGEIVHSVSVFTGFLLLLFPVACVRISVCLPVALINALLNLPFIFIQRYNFYKFELLRKRKYV